MSEVLTTKLSSQLPVPAEGPENPIGETMARQVPAERKPTSHEEEKGDAYNPGSTTTDTFETSDKTKRYVLEKWYDPNGKLSQTMLSVHPAGLVSAKGTHQQFISDSNDIVRSYSTWIDADSGLGFKGSFSLDDRKGVGRPDTMSETGTMISPELAKKCFPGTDPATIQQLTLTASVFAGFDQAKAWLRDSVAGAAAAVR